MKLRTSFFGALVLLTLAVTAIAQKQLNATEKSYRRARQILDAGIAAHGGPAALRRAQNFSLKLKGMSYQLFQSRDPEMPHEGWAMERTMIIDTERHRLLGERILRRPNSSYIWWAKDIIVGDEGFEMIVHEKWALPMSNPSLTDQRDLFFHLPQNLLSDVLQRASTLRWLGSGIHNGRRQDLITYTRAGGTQITLYFDARTHLLTKYENLYTRNVFGDAVAEYVFTGYRQAGGIIIPSGRKVYHSGIVSTETEYSEVSFGREFEDHLFKLPADFTKIQFVESKPAVAKLAEDVYLLQNLSGGYNSLFVAFEDHILVVEAPENDIRDGISEQAFRMIKETIPNKPIKYLALTHHHGDHASGLRTFIADGATVVTTPGNKRFVERVAAAKFTMSPDALARNPRPLKLEIIADKKLVLEDSKHRVELYDIGGIPHSEEMVIAYLPKEKILFQSDLFNPVTPGAAPIVYEDPFHGVDDEDTKSLLRFIRQEKLEVERIAGSHGRIATFDELVIAARQNP